MLAKISNAKTTTAVGGISVLTGIIVSLVPSSVRDVCFGAVQESDNPMFVGILLIAGLGLTLVGPSLKKSE